MEQMRKCGKCKKDYPLTWEYFHRTGDGFVNYCKPCRSEMQKEHRRKDRASSIVPAHSKNRRIVKTRAIKRPADPSRIPTTTATPAEILIALRKGMAQEIVAMIKEKYDL